MVSGFNGSGSLLSTTIIIIIIIIIIMQIFFLSPRDRKYVCICTTIIQILYLPTNTYGVYLPYLITDSSTEPDLPNKQTINIESLILSPLVSSQFLHHPWTLLHSHSHFLFFPFSSHISPHPSHIISSIQSFSFFRLFEQRR